MFKPAQSPNWHLKTIKKTLINKEKNRVGCRLNWGDLYPAPINITAHTHVAHFIFPQTTDGTMLRHRYYPLANLLIMVV